MKYSELLSAAKLFEKLAMEVCPRCGYTEKPQEINVASILSKLVDPHTKMAMVPDVIKAFLKAGLPLQLAKKQLLNLAKNRIIELRPYSGLKPLSKEDQELSIPGPQGSFLAVLRAL